MHEYSVAPTDFGTFIAFAVNATPLWFGLFCLVVLVWGLRSHDAANNPPGKTPKGVLPDDS